MATLDNDLQHRLYIDCLTKQLEEINLLSSIYCNSSELEIHDPSVISELNEFIDGKTTTLRSQLDFSIYFQRDFNKTHLRHHHHQHHHQQSNKIEIRFCLPHLYPSLENANAVVRNSLFTKQQEIYINKSIQNFINEIDKNETYCYQVITWLQDNLDEFLSTVENTENNIDDALEASTPNQVSSQTLNANDIRTSVLSSSSSSPSSSLANNCVANKEIFERLWIYSHHIKSKTKRQEILRNAKDLQLTGFSRPGKPGIICVEGLQYNTQKFWRIIKSMHWQKITIRKIETKQISSITTEAENGTVAAATAAASSSSSFSFASTTSSSSLLLVSPKLSCIDRYRRFSQFKEELFTNIGGDEKNEEKMNMSLFIKFLELHNSGYMKKELFGID